MPQSIFTPQRRGRRYSPQFKARLIAQCSEPGISVATLAREHGVSPATLQRWLDAAQPVDAGRLMLPTAARDGVSPAPPFVPLGVAATPSPGIRIRVQREAQEVTIDWPVSAAADCGAWLRGLLA